MLRMSSLFLRTLREDPADAEVPSHRLLVRAGYVRRTAAGVYTWLPLGKIVLDRLAAVIREEMDRIGGQEILFSALLPREPYERSGRWEEYGPELFRLKDRRGSDYLLGPTHEEMFTLLVKGEYSSYKDLPLLLYQIQTKYRDELRPRSGVIRGREFTMKDSYSFDIDDDGLRTQYAAHREAYARILDRLGVRFRIVAALSGAMGGSESEEFLAPTPVGEDTFVACSNCDYAANTEAAESAVRTEDYLARAGVAPMSEVHTPGASSIDAVAALLGAAVAASDLLKTMVVRVGNDIVVVCVPGDRDLDEERLAPLSPPRRSSCWTTRDSRRSPTSYAGSWGRRALPPTAYGCWRTSASRPGVLG